MRTDEWLGLRTGLISGTIGRRGVLFSTEGSTGWRRRRDLGGYKGSKKEGDFSHLHEKFADPGDDAG
jgi:hypothetical protein